MSQNCSVKEVPGPYRVYGLIYDEPKSPPALPYRPEV